MKTLNTYSYTMEEAFLAVVKTAMEASFVEYKEEHIRDAVMNPKTGVITCTYIHPTDPNTTYIVSIVGENFLVSVMEHEYI